MENNKKTISYPQNKDQRGYSQRNDRREQPSISQEYKSAQYYVDDEPNKDFIVKYALEIAGIISRPEKKDHNKSSQIRKYYEFARRVEMARRAGKITLKEAVAEMSRLQSFAEYAKERDKVSREFCEFITINTKRIETDRDITFFVKHFEAIIGFSKNNK